MNMGDKNKLMEDGQMNNNEKSDAPQFVKGSFRKELSDLINSHWKETGSDTSDFILAEYLDDCLSAFDKAVKRRREWWGPKEKTSEKMFETPLEKDYDASKDPALAHKDEDDGKAIDPTKVEGAERIAKAT